MHHDVLPDFKQDENLTTLSQVHWQTSTHIMVYTSLQIEVRTVQTPDGDTTIMIALNIL